MPGRNEKTIRFLGQRKKKLIKILGDKKDSVSLALFNLRKSVLSEFFCLPRSLNDLDYWKATEFREFLLFTSFIVLKSIGKNGHYNHFLILFTSIRILCSGKIFITHSNLVSKLVL